MVEYRKIRDVAAALGVKASTLRRWEREGLIAPAARSPGNQRMFSTDAVAALVKTPPAKVPK
jgi:DNA-binding transcriptional MerR regulator